MIFAYLLLAVLVCINLVFSHGVKISALDSNIVFEGRCTTDEKSGTMSFDHPGVRVTFTVKGTTTISMLLSAYVILPNRFWVIVNGTKTSTVIDTSGMTSAATSSVIVASGLDSRNEHTITIAKITEAQYNSLYPESNYVIFHGFEVEEGGHLLPAFSKASRKIEFVGDSITAGYCDLCNTVDSSQGPYTQESNYLAYGTLTCGRLQASCHTAAWSGYGMVRNCCGGTTLMPEIYSRTLASVPGSVWNMSTWQPNAVVINLGTNDHLNAGTPEGEYELSYVKTYVQFVSKISQAYSASNPSFFLACGPMTSSYCGYVKDVLSQVSSLGISAHFLDLTNIGVKNLCCGHPSAEDQQLMADTASKLIADTLNWN